MEEEPPGKQDEKLSRERTEENPQSYAETPGFHHCDSGKLAVCDDTMLLSYEQVPSTSKKIMMLIEGNIGAGKTTFLDILRDRFGIFAVKEPVDRWQNVGYQPERPGGRNILQS